jgi:hypothetical protein
MNKIQTTVQLQHLCNVVRAGECRRYWNITGTIVGLGVTVGESLGENKV